ncbi:CpaF family protein [Limnohabitans sp. Jir72]|uniref:CpaF family protein n=1 Tax=Limnohabitans sp. Jir72 TaxID=1977909 RepID=UPI000D3A495D|nr:CpaF family protein [Limnohabitans sp. Jir72]PUE31377.1 pilus assembly protein CpaF [Limnohabitans sp. Jir72]
MATLKEKISAWSYSAPGTLAVNEGSAVVKPLALASDASSPLQLAKPAADTQPVTAVPAVSGSYYALKTRLHQSLIAKIDLAAAETMPPDQLRTQLREVLLGLISDEAIPMNEHERRSLVADLQHEVLGLGPLEPLLADPDISEIMVNGFDTVFVEKRGRIERAPIRFNDDTHLLKIIDKIVSRVGRRVDESSPMVDARLPDGSRVNAIIAPVALDGPALSIRRFAVKPLKMSDLIDRRTLTPGMAELLAGLVKAKTNILISGGTGSGKTTLLNILSSYIPEHERIITIEDTAELQMQQSHVVRLETRPANSEGRGEISMRSLVKNSLRMRPDRIVLGEVRGGEVIDMLQAMNTGHDGSLTTVHANTPRDALARLENLVGLGGVTLPVKPLRQQIASAINVIVQATRLSDGSRKITSIHEITGMEGDVISSQEIFHYERTGVATDGAVLGRFKPTGIRPLLADRLKVSGVGLSDDMFNPLTATE